MIQASHRHAILLVLGCAALLAAPANAQRRAAKASNAANTSTYDASREVSVQGTVLSYVENSSAPPIGAHVTLQTSSGNLDVHLGDARLLKMANFSVSAGGSLRVIGENVAVGAHTFFLARIIQQGSQALAVRTTRGMPLWTAGARVLKTAQPSIHGGAR